MGDQRWQVLWDYERPAVSEARLRDLRDRITDPRERAVVRTRIARALGLQGQFARAHAELDAIILGVQRNPMILTRTGGLVRCSTTSAGPTTTATNSRRRSPISSGR